MYTYIKLNAGGADPRRSGYHLEDIVRGPVAAYST